MNSILIVDNNKVHREYLINRMKSIHSTIDIKVSNKVAESLKIAHSTDISAFFMDIQLSDGNGLNLAYQLRKINKYKFTPIVFLTAIPTREIEAFRNIHCYDYLIKPICENDLDLVLKQILVDYLDFCNKNEKDNICLCFNGIKQIIQLKDILYIEFKFRKIVIITQYGEIIYKSISLKKFIQLLTSHFVQIHQSIVINKDHLKKIDMKNNSVELHGLTLNLPIGVSFRKNIDSLL